MQLHPGQEWWTDYRYQLLARIRADARKGVIQPVELHEIAPGFYGALIVRLKPRPPAWRKPVLLLAAGVPVLALLGALVFQAAQWVMAAWPVAILLGLIWAAVRHVTGHRAVCVGLHCSGCKE